MLPAWLGLSASVFKWQLGRAVVLEHVVNKEEGVEEEQSCGLSKAREGVVSIQATECIGKN